MDFYDWLIGIGHQNPGYARDFLFSGFMIFISTKVQGTIEGKDVEIKIDCYKE